MGRVLYFFIFSIALLIGTASQAEQKAFSAEKLEDLKRDVIKLNRDLLILEEDLLYPAQSQVAFYVSVDIGHYFQLDAVKLHVDNKLTASHLYTEHQRNALMRGGIQPLHKGNLKSGEYTISAFFTGFGPEGREYKRGATLDLKKTDEPAVIELRISDKTGKQQPDFELIQWPAP
ncbi:AraC family transcriptional regulator [Microbulbifer sp. GL-2]|uniref:AraC family transcriptional regulator n=1 Tax=Microbulbifer sp. GL-2 TaxID=2591606 RepID=UPI0011645D2E|nr:AraC family transcriptional regulator [Microbulbifer sp. GL-2]BBM01575.1 hypothetical protein GL2_16490 [Microbulbifer sp. GL-2]